MRPVRVIHLDGLRYKYVSITQSPTKMVVRILLPVDNTYLNLDGSEILTCNKLKWKTINIEGQGFQIVGEAIFDLEDPLHKSWFQPNANICFTVNHGFANGDIAIIPMHMFSAGKEKTPDWERRHGYYVVAQLYCWSASDTIEESPCSFAADEQGSIFTNINENRLVHVDRQWMQRKDRSDFLCIMHHLQVSVKNNLVVCSLDCKDYLGNIIDVNGIYKVECNAGYLPQNTLNVKNGKCEFIWVPLLVNKSTPILITLKDSQNYICNELSFTLE